MKQRPRHPLIGITANVNDRDALVRRTYVAGVLAAGGVPVILVPPGGDAAQNLHTARAQLGMLDGLVLTGGDDPDLTRRGMANHPASTIMHPDRQNYEEALLTALDDLREMPTLGICLGMQQMSLHAGGALNQHLPDNTPTASDHTADHHHEVRAVVPHPVIDKGRGASWHHQAVRDAGRLRVVALAHDGVIEAVDDPTRAFYLGVQWHPERTTDEGLGERIFRALVEASRA